ncbi:MAG: PEP-CTERM sorting domain-containing protein [Colwellia sp.]|nr:PEP-CTERM sorting domain-containing protein [Colwellia sp.]
MLSTVKVLGFVGLVLTSTTALASVTTASFGSVVDTGNNMNQFSVNVDNVTINVSGWSDTFNQGGHDDWIRRATDLDEYNGGWAMQNADEPNNYCGSNGHSADNFGSNCGGYRDYDFFLLEFSEKVTLTQATYGWVSEGNASQNQVSVAALDADTFSGDLFNMTWSGVQTNHTLASDYSQMENSSGYYTNFSNGNTSGVESTYWLIGALNTVFGGDYAMEGNDGMKLAGVSFTKGTPTSSTSVPEPSSIAIFALGLMGLLASNRKKSI